MGWASFVLPECGVTEQYPSLCPQTAFAPQCCSASGSSWPCIRGIFCSLVCTWTGTFLGGWLLLSIFPLPDMFPVFYDSKPLPSLLAPGAHLRAPRLKHAAPVVNSVWSPLPPTQLPVLQALRLENLESPLSVFFFIKSVRHPLASLFPTHLLMQLLCLDCCQGPSFPCPALPTPIILSSEPTHSHATTSTMSSHRGWSTY